MNIDSFNSHYPTIEFNYYIGQFKTNYTHVLDLLIDCKIEDFNEEDFTNIFILENEGLTYIFSDFKVNEFYEDKGFLRVICVK